MFGQAFVWKRVGIKKNISIDDTFCEKATTVIENMVCVSVLQILEEIPCSASHNWRDTKLIFCSMG